MSTIRRPNRRRGAGSRFSLCHSRSNMSSTPHRGIKRSTYVSPMSSIHEGVSCDGCMAPNFAGDRYKCLRCYDFDLCSRCYMEERSAAAATTAATGAAASTAPSENRSGFREPNEEHSPSHPMQCIMTQQDFELAYQGDQTHSWDRLRVVIFTCPVCGLQGLSRERLVSHVIDEHSTPPRSPTQRHEMACPICISTDFYRIGFGDYMPNHLTDMVAHMQEHHMQAQYANAPTNSNNATSDTANVLSEFLRDRDLRRVIVHNVPLIGNDSDVEEPAADGATRRVTSGQRGGSQRIETVSRIRRRPVDRSVPDTNQSGENDSSAQPPAGFSRSTAVQPPAGYSSGRSPMQPATGLSNPHAQPHGGFSSGTFSSGRLSRSPSSPAEIAARDAPVLAFIGHSSLPVGSVAEAPLSPYESQMAANLELPPSNSATVRTFQYPITAYSRPSVPNHGAHRIQRNSGESSRTMGYARRLLVREHDQPRSEAAVDAPPGLRRPDSTETSNATSALVPPVRLSARSAARSRRADAGTHTSGAVGSQATSNVDSQVVLDVSCGDSGLTDNSTDVLEQLERQVEQNASMESKKSLKYCTLFTALAKPSCLPVLKIERIRPRSDDQAKRLDTSGDSDAGDCGSNDEIPLLHLVMRIGRPLRNTYAQRNRRTTQQQQPYDAVDDIGDWWSSQLSEHLRAESALRANQANVGITREASGVMPQVVPDRSMISRGEVALNRAMEALRRLDARNPHINRSPVPHDDITQTNNPAYLNGNIIPPPGMGSRHGQVLPSALGSTLFLGADSVAEAVAREVAAFSEASGLNIRQLQGLIRREEQLQPSSHLPPNPRSSSARLNSIPAPSSLSETRTRKTVKLPAKDNEQHDEDYNDFINDAFKAPEVDSSLDAQYMTKKRSYNSRDMKTGDQKEAVVPWLDEQRAFDFSVDISDTQLDGEIIELFKQIPEFKNDELIKDGKIVKDESTVDSGSNSEEETMFDPEKGSDEEMLTKKCESADLKRPHGEFLLTGIFGSKTSEQNEFEVDYWKDYRFLCNRRDVFVLKKSIDVPPEFMPGPLDYRLVKQLVFGKLDVPVSFYNRSYYLPEMFMRILRTNLRVFYLSQETKEFLEGNMEEVVPTLENEDKAQWDARIIRNDSGWMKTPLEVFPELWYFLDLASFFEPKINVLNVQNK